MEDPILVTVVTPIYNTGREVIESIDSVESSGFESREHVLVDDASTDDSPALVLAHLKEIGSKAIWVQNESNRGIAGTKMRALQLAQGKYIVSLSDDRMRPNMLHEAVNCLEAQPELDVVFGLVSRFEHGTNRALGVIGHWKGQEIPGEVIDAREMASELLLQCFIPSMAAVIRRETLLRFGYDESMIIEDYPLWIRMLTSGCRFAHIPSVWIDYRQTSNSIQKRKPSAVEFDALRSRMLFRDSGLMDKREFERVIWRVYWSKITVFETKHRRSAFTTLAKECCSYPSSPLVGLWLYGQVFFAKYMSRLQRWIIRHFSGD